MKMPTRLPGSPIIDCTEPKLRCTRRFQPSTPPSLATVGPGLSDRLGLERPALLPRVGPAGLSAQERDVPSLRDRVRVAIVEAVR